MPTLTLDQAIPRLRQAYRSRRLIPFLGSGFSVPLSLPTWDRLMGWMGEELGFDPALFKLHGSSPQLASYYAFANTGGLKPFIQHMQAKFHAPEVDERRRTGSPQHTALGKLDFDRIYTTNFEHHIEEALRDGGKDVEVLVSLEDFVRPHRENACRVVKFHGDLRAPDTVVLTESQFYDRFRLEAGPDQFLRADLLGNSFLFIGYSFSDINIRYIWHRMHRLLLESGHDGTHKAPELRSYLATFGAGHVQPQLLDAWNIDLIELDPRDKSSRVAELLSSLR